MRKSKLLIGSLAGIASLAINVGCGPNADFNGAGVTASAGAVAADFEASKSLSVASVSTGSGPLSDDIRQCMPALADPLLIEDAWTLSDQEILTAVEQRIDNNLQASEKSVTCFKDINADVPLVKLAETLVKVFSGLLEKVQNDQKFQEGTVFLVKLIANNRIAPVGLRPPPPPGVKPPVPPTPPPQT